MRVFITTLNPYWQEVEDRSMVKDGLVFMGKVWFEASWYMGAMALGFFIGGLLG